VNDPTGKETRHDLSNLPGDDGFELRWEDRESPSEKGQARKLVREKEG